MAGSNPLQQIREAVIAVRLELLKRAAQRRCDALLARGKVEQDQAPVANPFAGAVQGTSRVHQVWTTRLQAGGFEPMQIRP